MRSAPFVKSPCTSPEKVKEPKWEMFTLINFQIMLSLSAFLTNLDWVLSIKNTELGGSAIVSDGKARKITGSFVRMGTRAHDIKCHLMHKKKQLSCVRKDDKLLVQTAWHALLHNTPGKSNLAGFVCFCVFGKERVCEQSCPPQCDRCRIG